MNYRMAVENDFASLAELRWRFRKEGGEISKVEKPVFIDECSKFFTKASAGGSYTFWIAEESDQIVGSIFIHRIELVPRPCRIEDNFGYLTNSYVIPEFRGKGVGSELLSHAVRWAKSNDFELLIVYPSDVSITFYERAGFDSNNDVMELRLRAL